MRHHPGRNRIVRLLAWLVVPVAAFALGSPPAMAAGTTKVTGTIMDGQGNPLAGVKVYFRSQDVKGKKIPPTKTNKKGKFSYPFLDITSGNTFQVVPELPGYKVVRVQYVSVDSFGSTRDKGDKVLDQDQQHPSIRFHLIGQGTVVAGKNEVHFIMAPEAQFAKVRDEVIVAKLAAAAPEEADRLEQQKKAEAERKKKEVGVQTFESGVAMASRGDHEEAAKAFTAFLEQEPRNDAAHYELGKSLLELGRTDEAIAEFEKSLELNPDRPGAHFRIGIAYARAERYPEAEGQFRAELENSPEEPSVLYNLSIALVQQGREEEAVPYLEQVVELQPSNADANWKLAKLYEARGDGAMAEARYQVFAEANPEMAARAFFNIGQEAFRRRDREEAAAAFRKALEINPNHAEAHRQLGYCLVGMQDFDGAIEHFQKFLELDPNSSHASEIRSTITALQG